MSTDLDPHTGKCKWHGGGGAGQKVTTGARVVRPWLRIGKWSEGKGELGKLVDQNLASTELPDLDDPLRILQACLDRYAQLTDQNDGRDYREGAVELFHRCNSGGDDALPWNTLLEYLEKGANELSALDRVRDTSSMVHQRREANEKLRLARQNALSFPEALSLVASVLEIVARLAPDKAPEIVLEVKAKAFRSSPQLAAAE